MLLPIHLLFDNRVTLGLISFLEKFLFLFNQLHFFAKIEEFSWKPNFKNRNKNNTWFMNMFSVFLKLCAVGVVIDFHGSCESFQNLDSGAPYTYFSNNISSVVEFQRWWVLKSKLFGQEWTYSKKFALKKSFDELRFVKKCQNRTFKVNT